MAALSYHPTAFANQPAPCQTSVYSHSDNLSCQRKCRSTGRRYQSINRVDILLQQLREALTDGRGLPSRCLALTKDVPLLEVLLSTETVGLLGTGAQDVHLDFHTAPELSCSPLDVG